MAGDEFQRKEQRSYRSPQSKFYPEQHITFTLTL